MIEESILKTLYSFSNPFLDLAAIMLSYGIIIFAFVVLLSLFKKKKHFIPYSLGVLLTLGITQLIKWIVQRPRPYLIIGGIQKAIEPGFSFPSMHAGIAFFIAVFLAKDYKKYSPLLFIFAILVCLSRVYLMVHYFTDVIAGAILGFIIGYIFINKEKVILKCTKKFYLK